MRAIASLYGKRECTFLSASGSSNARLIGIVVFLLIVSLGEFIALLLNYQNNFFLRQYVSII
jgi:hypothetical protein